MAASAEDLAILAAIKAAILARVTRGIKRRQVQEASGGGSEFEGYSLEALEAMRDKYEKRCGTGMRRGKRTAAGGF